MKRRRVVFRRECSELTARWCPVHGTCVCTTSNGHGGRTWDEMNHMDCPLHSSKSTHPLPVRKVIARRAKGVH